MLHYTKNLVSLIPNVARLLLLSSSEKTLLKQSQAIIAVSKFTYNSAIKYVGVRSTNWHIVPNGIDTSLFAEQYSHNAGDVFRKRYGLISKKLVLYVGRVERSKGLDFLIQGFAKVSDRFGDARLVIVGSGNAEYLNRLRREARREGIDQDTLFLGKIEQDLLLGAFHASDLVVLPSLMEGFGLTLLEAMTAGKPVVATRVGAIPEVVENGLTGLLVDPGDSSKLADAIVQILENPAMSRSMGERGRKISNDRYTLERMGRLTEKVYREILD
jgi:glycosyltransferase involved in cell wall biosynthesis